MASEGSRLFLEVSFLEQFSNMVEITLQEVMETEEARSKVASLIFILESLPHVIEAMLEPLTVPETSASRITVWRQSLEGILEALNDVYTREIIPEDTLFSLRGIGLYVLDQLTVITEGMLETMSFNVEQNARFSDVIRQLRGLADIYYRGLQITNAASRSASREGFIIFFVNDLREILSSVPVRALTNAAAPTVDEGDSASEEDILKRNTLQYKYRKVQRSADKSEILESCVICRCDLEDNDDIRRLPCIHLFHAKCIDRWMTTSSRCPICRSDVLEVKVDFPLNLKDSLQV